MAAYGAVLSLMNIMGQLQNHRRPPITLDKDQMQSLSEKVCLIQHFLESCSPRDCEKAQGPSESCISEAVYAAEDIIEAQIVHEILAGSTSHGDMHSNNLFSQSLQRVIEDMGLVAKQIIKIQESSGIQEKKPRYLTANSLPIRCPSSNGILVGLDDVFHKVVCDKLTPNYPNLQILSITGMAGIGKTKFVTEFYSNPSVMGEFHFCIWLTISQEYRAREIILEALRCVERTAVGEMSQASDYELGHRLYDILSKRKYLIIMDDMWSIEAWDDLKYFFPDDGYKSLIIITTRQSNIASHYGWSSIRMNLLDADNSWKLLCETVFPRGCCPLELEDIGKKIAKSCGGLPLSIVVVGGLLANSKLTREYWEDVAANLRSIIKLADNELCSKSLYSSYNHLPAHLKPCFLYMGIFPEDDKICVSWLIKLWVAEGFLKPVEGRSLEVVAQGYLNDLIDRNLVLVDHAFGVTAGKVKYCKVHYLFRDLCLRIAFEEKFMAVTTPYDFGILKDKLSQRHIGVNQSTSGEYYHQTLSDFPLASHTRSLICNFHGVLPSIGNFTLMRVFKAVDKDAKIKGYISFDDVFKLVNSRYLALSSDKQLRSVIPSLINSMWNLHTLIVKGGCCEPVIAPLEIWEMLQLRHLEIVPVCLQYPIKVPKHENCEFVLRNLQSLSDVNNFRLSKDIVRRIPYIRKLKVNYNDCSKGWSQSFFKNLVYLEKLETLTFSFPLATKQSHQKISLHDFEFPLSLKKLTLIEGGFPWEEMTKIGSLPNLEKLKLLTGAFNGLMWSPVDGEFLCLKHLVINESTDLKHWMAESIHFPLLEHLGLMNLEKLEQIPLDIGEIGTLQTILMMNCKKSAVISAKNIDDVQNEFGESSCQIRVFVQMENEQDDLDRLESKNFKVKYCNKD